MAELKDFGVNPVQVRLVFCEKQVDGLDFNYNHSMVLPALGDTIGRLGFLSDRQKMLVVWSKLDDYAFTPEQAPYKQDLKDMLAFTRFDAGSKESFKTDDLEWPSPAVQALYNELELMYVQCSTWEVVWREFNYHNECTTIELWLDTVE